LQFGLKRFVLISTMDNYQISTSNGKRNYGNGMALGAAFGIAIGAALGAATNNMEVWVAVGAAIGVAMGRLIRTKSSRKSNC